MSFLTTLLMMVVPTVPTIEVSSAPPQFGLPKYVQEMSAEDYEAWAIWQNAVAAKKTERAALYSIERPTYTVERRTTSSRSGGRVSGAMTRQTSRNKGGGSAAQGNTSRSQSGWRSSTTTTVPTEYKNPRYCPKSLTVYNPYVKSTSDHRPDWDNLYVPVDRRTITVTEAVRLSDRPMSPETVFRLLMQPKNVVNIRK